ncbi:MAG: hypothetical protein WA982_09230 [Rubrobacteraceae bacterium]
MSDAVKDQIIDQLSGMSEEEQRRVLGIVRSIAERPGDGVSGSSLIRFAGAIDEDDARRMSEAIEEGCEQIEPNEW